MLPSCIGLGAPGPRRGLVSRLLEDAANFCGDCGAGEVRCWA